MKVQKTLIIIGLSLQTLCSAGQTVQQDNTYRIGTLPNGMTYYLRHNAKEPGLASFYLAQRVGSILEEPHQRGLAHFLEHMAFNGTEHFKGDQQSIGIIPWCERIGVKFGTNLNAYTSIDQTVYNVSSVPLKREGIIDSTLLILHDWSHSLLLTDKEIDKERGVIHEEWRTRRAGMATQRMIEQVLPTIYAGTKYADCLPIGYMDIVDHFPYKALRDYYQKWYRPDLQAVVIVGDIDVDKMEQKVKKVFGTIPSPSNPAKRIYYPVTDNKEMIVAIEKDNEQPIMLANLYMKHEATADNEKNRVSYLRDGYISELITYMLNGRLQDLQRQSNPPYLSATVKDGDFFVSQTKEAFSLSFGCKQEDVKASFDAAIGAIEQARRFGFTPSELERAKQIQMKAAKRKFAERNDRGNRHYIAKALSNFLQKEPILSSEENLKLITQFGGDVSLEEVNKQTKALISNKNEVLVVYAPDKPNFKIPSKEEFEKYVREAQNKAYTAYTEPVVSEELLAKKPKAGSIKSESPYRKFGTTRILLSNGVEVFVKPTTFNKDRVNMNFWGEGGTSLYPEADAPNFNYLTSMITEAGVGTFDESTLRKKLASKIVKVQPSIGHETQSLNGTSSVKDLETMFQLAYLYFTQPRKDPQAFESAMNRMRSFLQNREASSQVVYNDSVSSIVYGDHPRTRPSNLAALQQVSLDKIYSIYQDRFRDASGFKMIITGNVDMPQLRKYLCQYVASLPGKGRKEHFADTYPQVRAVNETHVFKHKMKTPSALVNVIYTFPEDVTPRKALALNFFKRVLTIAYTDSVREEKGGTYGVSVKADMDVDSKPTTLVKLSFRTDPSKYEALMPIVYHQIELIAKNGPASSSMDKAREYLKKAYGQAIITNDYWEYVLYNDIRNGIDYDKDYLKLVDSITPSDVKQLAADLLRSKRRIEVTMISE